MILQYHRRAFTLPALLLLVLIQACAMPSVKRSPGNNNLIQQSVQRVELGRVSGEPLMLIARDFVNAIVQIPGLDPQRNTISARATRTKFHRAISTALAERGYRIRTVNSSASDTMLVTSVNRRSSNTAFTHIVSVGGVSLKRSYTVKGNRVVPVSSLFVRGVDTTSIQLDDRVFLAASYNPKVTNGGRVASVASRADSTPATQSSINNGAGDLYLCTPDGKGIGTDGWACRTRRDGKQWIDEKRRSTLVAAGIPAANIEWDKLMAMPDIAILDVSDTLPSTTPSVTKLASGSLFLCTPDGKGTGTDGWLCREGQRGKQWIDPAQRSRLVTAGVPSRWVDWSALMAMVDTRFVD